MVLCAIGVAIAVLAAPRAAAGRGTAEFIRSPAGAFTLVVEPIVGEDAGAALYRLQQDGVALWEARRPQRFRHALVTDLGITCGAAIEGTGRDYGELVVSVLDAAGRIRAEHRTPRTSPPAFDVGASPSLRGMFHDAHTDALVVRTVASNADSPAETWWLYSVATGEQTGAFRPDAALPREELHSRVLEEVRSLPDTGLAIVRWRVVAWRERDVDAEYALVDLWSGQLAWRLQRPEDGDAASKVEEDALQRRMNRHGAILAAEPGGAFALWLVADGVRADYRAVRDPGTSTGVRVVEERRFPFEPAEGTAARTGGGGEIELPPEPAAPPIALARLGSIALAAAPGAAPAPQEIAAARIDALSRTLLRDARTGAVEVYGPDGRLLCTIAAAPPARTWRGSEVWLDGGGNGDVLIGGELPIGWVRCDAEGRSLGALALDGPLAAGAGDSVWSLGPDGGIVLRDRAGAAVRAFPRRYDGRVLGGVAAAAAAADGVLYGYVYGALLGFEPGGRALPEIALPRERLERPRVSVSDRFVAVFGEDGRTFLVDRASGAVHRWRPEGAAAGAHFALSFSPDGAELLALRWSDLVLERYALPR